MALYKRNAWYYSDFTVHGQRYRQSLDTKDWREAQRKEKKIIAKAQEGKLTPSSISFSRLGFSEAADKYVTGRRLELAPLSQVKEKQLLVKLREYFQGTRLRQIGAEQVLAYREWRSSQGVGPAIINMEVGVLRRILKRAKRWHLMADDIKNLKEPDSIGRVLVHEEKVRLLRKASQKPEWETAYWAAILTLNTTMRGCELRGLRWLDIDLIERTLTIPKSKTPAGERVTPLTEEAYQTLLKLRRRAEMFGPVEPSHYVFASFRPRGRFQGTKLVEMRMTDFDPTQPVKSWRTAWRTLTKKAGLPGLRFHDMRHQLITELGESGASDQIIMAIAGHVSRRMLDRYSHVRLEAKRQALEKALGGRRNRPSERGYVTNHVTKSGEEDSMPAEVIESNGRPERARTADLYRVKVAL